MLHEQLKDFQNNKNVSNKAFGIQLSLILLIVFLIRFYFDHFGLLEIILISLTAIITIIAYINPSLLNFLRIIFFNLAKLLARFFNPIIMLVFYVIIMLPFGIFLKIFQYDPLKEKINKNLKTYWIYSKKVNKRFFRQQF